MILKCRPILLDGFEIKDIENKVYSVLYFNDLNSDDEYFNIFGNVYVGDILISISNVKKSLTFGEVLEIVEDDDINCGAPRRVLNLEYVEKLIECASIISKN